MTSQNGGSGSAATITDVIVEPPPNAPAAPSAGGQATSPATRTELRAKQKFQQNRFVIIGAGALVVALLLFVAVSMPRKNTSQRPKTGATVGQAKSQQGEPASDGRSLLPITDSGRPIAKETHDGFVDEQDLQRTATRSPCPREDSPPVTSNSRWNIGLGGQPEANHGFWVDHDILRRNTALRDCTFPHVDKRRLLKCVPFGFVRIRRVDAAFSTRLIGRRLPLLRKRWHTAAGTPRIGGEHRGSNASVGRD